MNSTLLPNLFSLAFVVAIACVMYLISVVIASGKLSSLKHEPIVLYFLAACLITMLLILLFQPLALFPGLT